MGPDGKYYPSAAPILKVMIYVGCAILFLLTDRPMARTERSLLFGGHISPEKGPIAGLVRAQTNTAASNGSLDLYPTCAKDIASMCTDSGCITDQIHVVSESRSYALTELSTCDEQFTDVADYSCVDYKKGAVYLAGKTLSYEVDLSGTGCGCNAALYLVSMPQNPDPTSCRDYYCDANKVCGVKCAELDLMEANSVGFQIAAHVAADPNGANGGIGHYVSNTSPTRFLPDHVCPYGKNESCTINTGSPFSVSVSFSAPGQTFGYNVTLSQSGRSITAGPIRYDGNETRNQDLQASLEAGMTLTLSNWHADTPSGMGWLDGNCLPNEKPWCNNTFDAFPSMFVCPGNDNSTMSRNSCPAYQISNLNIAGGGSPI